MRGITVRCRRRRAVKDSRIVSKKTSHWNGVQKCNDEMAEPSRPKHLGVLPVVSKIVCTTSRMKQREESHRVGNEPPPPPKPPDQNVAGKGNKEADQKRRWKVKVSWAPPSTTRPPDTTTTTGEWPNRRRSPLEEMRVREVQCEDNEKRGRIVAWSGSVELGQALNWVLGSISILMSQAQNTLGKVKMKSPVILLCNPTHVRIKNDTELPNLSWVGSDPNRQSRYAASLLFWVCPASLLSQSWSRSSPSVRTQGVQVRRLLAWLNMAGSVHISSAIVEVHGTAVTIRYVPELLLLSLMKVEAVGFISAALQKERTAKRVILEIDLLHNAMVQVMVFLNRVDALVSLSQLQH